MSVYGGLPPRTVATARPAASRAGTGPAPSQGIVLARLVLIRGTGDGEFVYDTAGNLRSANVGQVTKDPVKGITCQQGISTFNGHGAVITLQATALDASFLYTDTGTSTQGGLLSSQANGGGTDPFGNAFLGGVTDYFNIGGLGTSFVAVQLNNGQVTFNTATSAGGPWASGAEIDFSTAVANSALHLFGGPNGGEIYLGGQALVGVSNIELQAKQTIVTTNFSTPPVTTELLEVKGTIAAALVKAFAPGGITTEETWHTVGAAGQPAFVNSFSAGGTAPRFQLEPVNAGRVRLSGAVNTGAATAANTTMFTLPAGYVPSRQFGFVTANNVIAYALGNASVQVTTGGAVQLVPAGTAGKFVILDGICFELD